MEFFDRYRAELAEAFAEAAAATEQFPEHLGKLGRTMLDACNPLVTGKPSNYITYLLPYWMDDVTGLGSRVCRDLAAGSICAMMHYSIVDDLMDRPEAAADSRRMLALGQLFHAAFQTRYARHVRAEPERLWMLYERYTAEWAAAVGRESERRADPLDVRQLAGKSAPVKLGAAAMLITAGMDERLPEIEHAIELALAVLQLSDDWQDWDEDLHAPSGNAFLTIVHDVLEGDGGDPGGGGAERNGDGLADDRPLTEQDVKKAIFRRGALRRLSNIADGYAGRIEARESPAMLKRFARTLADSIRHGADETDRAVSRLITGGGFSRIISENPKN